MEELTIVAVKQRYGAATWKERIAACRSSGQSVAGWCSVYGINSKSYDRWEQKLLRETENALCCTQQTQQIQQPTSFTEIPALTRPADVIAVLRMGEITCEPHHEINPE